MIMSDVSTDTSTPAGGDKPKRSHKRLWITLGAVGVVLVSLAAGGLVWHQSPSFCNAACHTPMDAYVQGYDSGDTAILVTAHAEGPQGLSCLDCHEPTLGQQFTEGTHWVSGNYIYPLEQRDFGNRSSCLESGCHDETKIIAATANYGGAKGYNPHDPRHGKQQCNACHTMHGTSSLVCNTCHNLKLPEGWEPPALPGRTEQTKL